ncbi:hypothetical protein Aam_035_054 [Acidocella aminolytica 101 = DSM 11237]|uniref:Uncharacterized protein n=1 Tax=Acidocella aminolytica 101 = DSM 11237 TaxID=1120923 RepID=A0A0D6PED5_9PROT|nr:hypothetical protein Aam_035_054 [Acidocella aminolytica 101 = DSM 11237]GBQ40629.1 hypothetical protein AA11237_2431 [Acidocella aminolytica 101 = DSM 11237]
MGAGVAASLWDVLPAASVVAVRAGAAALAGALADAVSLVPGAALGAGLAGKVMSVGADIAAVSAVLLCVSCFLLSFPALAVMAPLLSLDALAVDVAAGLEGTAGVPGSLVCSDVCDFCAVLDCLSVVVALLVAVLMVCAACCAFVSVA